MTGDGRAPPQRAARYRDVFAVSEFRALFGAHVLSVLGDQVAKVAISVLVFAQTRSVLLSAVAFGIAYVPWVAGGPLLSALADRYPRRNVMVTCDVARFALVGLVAVPGFPVALLIILLFTASLFAPPYQSARSALLPEVLDGDSYVVAQGLSALTMQLAQVLGFAVGGALVAMISVRGAILVDAATFLVSALIVRAFVTHRPAATGAAQRWLASVAEGFRLVFGDPILRAYLLLAWVGATATAAPEGLMAAYAVHLRQGPATAGLLLAALPVGVIIGAVLYGRFTPPSTRERLIRPMAALACLALVPMALDPPLPVVLGLLTLAGYGGAYLIVLNALFVRAVPAGHRGRAHGLAAAGLMIGQGGGTAAAGAVADTIGSPPVVVALCGLAGLAAIAALAFTWRNHQ